MLRGRITTCKTSCLPSGVHSSAPYTNPWRFCTRLSTVFSCILAPFGSTAVRKNNRSARKRAGMHLFSCGCSAVFGKEGLTLAIGTSTERTAWRGHDTKRSDWRERSPPRAGAAGHEQPHDYAKPRNQNATSLPTDSFREPIGLSRTIRGWRTSARRISAGPLGAPEGQIIPQVAPNLSLWGPERFCREDGG